MEHRRHTRFQRILIGYDGSEQSEKAVDAAITIARCLDAYVLALAVARPPEPPTSVELEAALDDAREHFEAGLKRVVERGKKQRRDHRNRVCGRTSRRAAYSPRRGGAFRSDHRRPQGNLAVSKDDFGLGLGARASVRTLSGDGGQIRSGTVPCPASACAAERQQTKTRLRRRRSQSSSVPRPRISEADRTCTKWHGRSHTHVPSITIGIMKLLPAPKLVK